MFVSAKGLMAAFLVIGLVLVAPLVEAQEAEQSAQPVSITAQALVLTNVWLIDGTGAPVIDKAWVRIEGDRITAVGTGTPAPIAGARVMDLEGRTVLPGLIDTHVHLSDLEQARWMLKLLVAHGATTVKDAGNSLGNIVSVRRWMLLEAAVPRLFISGTVLAGPPGEMQFLSEGDRTAARVRDNIAFGVDVIKVHNWVSSQALQQIVSLAEANGLDVVGHVPLSMTSIAAVDAGMKIVMHASTLRASEVLDDPELVARYPIDLPYPLRWGYWAHFKPGCATLKRTLDAWEKRKEGFFFEPTLAVLEGMASTHDPEVRENEELQRLVSPRHAPVSAGVSSSATSRSWKRKLRWLAWRRSSGWPTIVAFGLSPARTPRGDHRGSCRATVCTGSLNFLSRRGCPRSRRFAARRALQLKP